MQHEAVEVICLTDDSETSVIQQPDFVPYNINDNELQFPTSLFVNIPPELVKNLPQNIDCMKIYKIKCLPREWVQNSQNLSYFKMHSSKRKELTGTRKVRRFIRNPYCPYDGCPFNLSADGKRNTLNFQNVDGCKISFSCGHVANRQWCRA